jgi:hypothetical protein
MRGFIESLSNYQLIEYYQVAVKMKANTTYLDKIQEELFLRMEGGEA